MSWSIYQEHRQGGGDSANVYEGLETLPTTPKKNLPLSAQKLRSTPFQRTVDNAAEKLATHPNITRRRSLTLAEFNPSFTVLRSCKRELQLSTSLVELESKKIAGRRIYNLLLLNAWRKRRTEAQKLLASKNDLESQNSNLESQIDALHRFRIAESEKREEAVVNAQNFQQELKDNLDQSKILSQEKASLENEMSECEQLLFDLNLRTKNTKNELMNKKCDLLNTRCKLGVEQNKYRRLATETNVGLGQASMMEIEVSKLSQEIENLQKQLLETELKLQDTLFNNNNIESENKELSEKLIDEFAKRDALEEHNADLKANLTFAQEALSNDLKKGLWKNAESLMFVCLNFLKITAVTMLPALPENVFENN